MREMRERDDIYRESDRVSERDRRGEREEERERGEIDRIEREMRER